MHSTFVGHSTEIIRQSKIIGPLLQTHIHSKLISYIKQFGARPSFRVASRLALLKNDILQHIMGNVKCYLNRTVENKWSVNPFS